MEAACLMTAQNRVNDMGALYSKDATYLRVYIYGAEQCFKKDAENF